MDKTSLRHKEAELFREWEDAIFARGADEGKRMVTDGAVNEQAYLNSVPKIVFMLKEAVCDSGGWDLREYLACEKDGKHYGKARDRRATWSKPVNLVLALRELWRLEGADVEAIDRIAQNACVPVNDALRREILQSIAALNVKKIPGGNVSNNSEIAAWEQEDAVFIQRQLDLYQPDIIICCGACVSYELCCGKPLAYTQTQGGFPYALDENRIIVRACHPAYTRVGKKAYVANVLSAVCAGKQRLLLD